MVRKLIAAAAFSMALASGPASAVPGFTLNGGYTGEIVIQFIDFESFTNPLLPPGSDNFGIFKITSIQDTIGTTLWTPGTAANGGGFLLGVFNDITINAPPTPLGGGSFQALASFGGVSIYLTPNDWNPAQGHAGYAAAGGGCAINQLCYNGISNQPDSALFLSLAYASGITANPVDTVSATLLGTTVPTTGTASGYLNVTGGLYASNFDTNGQTTAFGQRDFLINNGFCPNGVPNCQAQVGDWQLKSTDPVRGRFIPEPGTLALAGLALLGLGAFSRRRSA